MTRRVTMACTLALACALLPKTAGAETSSWFFWLNDNDGKNKQTTIKKKPGSEQTPAEPKGASSSSRPGTMRNVMPTDVPITGDNAAYLAFDQGRYLTALKLARQEAEKGQPQAHTLIGRIYGEGLGVQRNEKMAFDWFKKAADLGDTPAMFALGLMYAEGRGVEKNRDQAAAMFEKAALTGHAEANYNLGMLFLKGDGKPENPIRAFQHIRYAAEKGIPQAQYDLAALYQTGTGTSADAVEAARWLARAASHGLAAAEYEYAVVLLRGFGFTRDEKRIMPLLQSAARKGVAGAQNRLAEIYLDGKLVEKNLVEAVKWRTIAASSGLTDEELDKKIASLSAKDRQSGRLAANEWLDRSKILATP